MRRWLKQRQRPRNAVFDVHVHLIDRLAVLNGFVSGIALYPQVFKILATQNFAAVSLLSFVVILLNNIVWAVYAFHRALVSLLLAALLNIVASGVVIGTYLLLG